MPKQLKVRGRGKGELHPKLETKPLMRALEVAVAGKHIRKRKPQAEESASFLDDMFSFAQKARLNPRSFRRHTFQEVYVN